MRSWIAVLWALLPTSLGLAQAPPLISPTAALPPEKQRTKFVLPEGFEIQLVLSEPDIGQPMNLNFDAKGRLWVTHSVEYPYPAKGEGVEPRVRFAGVGEHPPRDRVTVVEEMGPDGGATRVRHFASGLNIPIGQTPLGDGSSALVYSIPSIIRHSDTNGDGQADKSEELYGRFGNVDTHGMANSFTPWIDGWIYGCHGFANHSVITDGRGNKTEMTSGNTYRFRADGSRFEPFTFGQVNPFGMAFDPLGNLFDADCHSMPVYLLLRGASYPHFGKKPDSLGFGPKMINHNHGSTGICGVCYYADTHFPPNYQGSLFICNPVTGRVHHDHLQASGSTYQVDTRPDLIRCEDPWFRPVDAVMGPDGALYIADFYNAIIGHYEVPLEHPKRDRERGRVWRLVYRGKEKKSRLRPTADLTRLTTEELVGELANENLLIRTQATNYLVTDHGEKPLPLLRKTMTTSASPEARAHALWVVERLAGLSTDEIGGLAKDPQRLVRVHLMKALAERTAWRADEAEICKAGVFDADAFVRRAAVDALGQHPHADNWSILLKAWQDTPSQDTHLIHTIRLALFHHFDSDAAHEIPKNLSKADARRLVPIASASSSPKAVAFLLEQGRLKGEELAEKPEIAARIAADASPDQLGKFLAQVRSETDDLSVQFRILKAVSDGLSRKGTRPETQEGFRAWFADIGPALLDEIAQTKDGWQHRPLPAHLHSPEPWGLRKRQGTNGESRMMIDSISQGEKLTGIYRSPVFEIPARFSFWMCGHNGPPGKNPPAVNHVRLKDLKTGEILAQEHPPRSDTAQKYVWDLGDHAGKPAVLELVDGSTLDAYAWIAVGGFDPPRIAIPGGRLGADADHLFEMIGRFQLTSAAPALNGIAGSADHSAGSRVAAASALISLGKDDQAFQHLGELVAQPNLDRDAKLAAIAALGGIPTGAARLVLTEQLIQSPASVQREIAKALCRSREGAESLLHSIDKGKASARLLQDAEIKARFDQHASRESQSQVAELLKSLPSLKEQTRRQIAAYKISFLSSPSSSKRGEVVFRKNCAACHKVGTEGKLIGPQLDGIGIRGLDRLLEDLLDPNRNVDAAFRTKTIVMADGTIHTGLPRREEGKLLVIADQKGQEISLAADQIEESKTSQLSLMPANFTDVLKKEELHDLLAYLLTLTTKPAE